ncbi:Leucine-rich repeat-containing protein 9 [Phytophthora cinnamomi]|uniref:Leucine-rich repeat-containing protein 9 n=1 Tax=Phytophthora cinnamomi TaxID=4785 RepID=UPI003559F4B8|nr:Leucine-rich repeat-containing protein 9 [Phytophthora cinnamomi]
MDWEANLAAIIRCTDASLEQQFRQFEDVTAEFAAEETPAQPHQGDNVAAAYLRETMAADYHYRQQQEREQRRPQTQTPSYSRVSGAFARGPTAPGQSTTTSFSEHFHRQQERKRGAATAGRARDNQRTHRRGGDYGPAEEEMQVQDHDVDESRYAPARQTAAGSGVYHQQMYASPTYDIAQMMEQVRLSLKLEVDARAAIAERQLSALLQLCKATSEELDRLRVEVCANDRQLHTLDQVQSKIRQELTTQKDIGFHLQSMCGKDESWRMQTENQLLELRQMVAALREQGNSTQAVAQEKLSRSELLVQFNAAMEPIKAQLQANLQHQAQQIAEITRTASSSSLLLDGVTQKVNRGITDELNELRSDLSALKHHVAKMDIFQDGGRGDSRSPPLSKEDAAAKAKEEQKQQDKLLAEVREAILKELTVVTKDYVDVQIKPIRKMADESGTDVASLDLLEHEINCDKVLKQCPHCLRRQKMSELQEHIENCDCRLVSCPNDCGGKFLQRGIPNHLATRCPKKPMTSTAPAVAAAPRPAYPDTNKSAPLPQATQSPPAATPAGKVECKFCDDEIEANKIDDHEQNCDWKPKRCQHCNMVVISRDLLRHETSCKTNLKSCPHCNENMPQSALTSHASRCSKRPIKCIRCSSDTKVEATTSDKLARRNLALSQLTNPGVPLSGGSILLQDRNNGARASAPSLYSTATTNIQTRLTMQHDGHEEGDDEEDEDDDEEYDDEDDNLTLAQVVKEWSVENVCLWLHEDVGVPDVVLRFQQKQCNGEMLLELTESDLINDFGVKDRIQRERILNAIEAINTSNAFSDEDDEDDDDEEVDDAKEDDEDELEESEEYTAGSSRPHMRHSVGGATYGHPRDILRRKSQPSPQRILDNSLPSSNDMLRRISNALENPKR